MTPFYADDWLTIYEGDCRAVLAELPSDSVDCVVTSPPYWGLRDYGTATWIGGDAECDHKPPPARRAERPLGAFHGGSDEFLPAAPFKDVCGRCGAQRQDSQLGLERTPEEYVANMVAVFREVRRVLKPSGTCWLNLGDSYATGTGRNDTDPTNLARRAAKYGTGTGDGTGPRSFQGMTHPTKPKDLVGIPWRVAFALQADGWYLRSDIIWSKPNPMPESVTDRPTKSHEYLFLLTKSARYYFDADAVREPAGEWPGYEDKPKGSFNGKHGDAAFRAIRSAGRNIRSVWTIATRPYPGAHFAVFPPELPERCIKAGSSERGVCPECGAPWERMVERNPIDYGMGSADTSRHKEVIGDQDARVRLRTPTGHTLSKTTSETTGWRPTCKHPTDPYTRGFSNPPAPAVILDPFAGSGTVGLVANRLSRRAILIDLNPEYLKQQMKRNAQTPLGLSEGVA